MKDIIVIHHSADFDGLFSREIARKFFGDTATYIGWDYGQPIPFVPAGARLYMLDISIDGLMDHPGLTWIDHHKTAMAKFNPNIRGYRIDGVAACRLAWQWFFRDTPGDIAGAPMPPKEQFVDRLVSEPYAVQLAGEYDIWDKRDRDVDTFQHALRSQELTDHIWRELFRTDIEETLQVQHSLLMARALMPLGRAIEYSSDQANASLMRDVAFELNWEGLRFLAINKPRGNSRTFAAGVKPEHDALLTFYWLRDKWRISLYGVPHRPDLDLSPIAAKRGGGGHRQACGFECQKLPFAPFELTVKDSMTCVSEAIKEQSGPGSYRDSWVANIAMPILDQRGKLDLTTPEGANAMAEILVRHFFET
jgi:hypothetical protein